MCDMVFSHSIVHLCSHVAVLRHYIDDSTWQDANFLYESLFSSDNPEFAVNSIHMNYTTQVQLMFSQAMVLIVVLVVLSDNVLFAKHLMVGIHIL